MEVLWEHSKGHLTSGTAGITENFLEDVMSALRFERCGRKEWKKKLAKKKNHGIFWNYKYLGGQY